MNYKPYVVGGLTGLLEIGITHPMDVHKTKRQVITTNVSRSMFAGIAPRLIGIIPMRVLFWGVQEDMRKRRFHPVMAGASAGLVQTLIDAPVDNHKIARITQTTPRWFRGFGVHALRNMGFASCVAACMPFYLGPIGAVGGVVLTHPLDTLKTSIQSGLPRQGWWCGLLPRTMQAFVAVTVGQVMVVLSTNPRYIKSDL